MCWCSNHAIAVEVPTGKEYAALLEGARRWQGPQADLVRLRLQFAPASFLDYLRRMTVRNDKPLRVKALSYSSILSFSVVYEFFLNDLGSDVALRPN